MAHPSAGLIIDLYRRYAADWVAMRRPGATLERSWLESFLALVPERPEVLDLGCGSGQPVAGFLIAKGATITGVDTSGPLLDHARAGNSAPHQWIEADMRGLDLGRAFDGLIAWHSFFHLSPEDQRKMFPVFARHVRPGGALMFTGADHQGETIGDWNGEPLYHGGLSADEYGERLDRAGFDIVHRIIGDAACGNSNVWLARRRS